jgi:uncharacterized membrane protein YqjE
VEADVVRGTFEGRPSEPPAEIDAVERVVDAAQRLVVERIELARLDVQEAMATTLWRTMGFGIVALLQLAGWWTLIAAVVVKLDDRLPLSSSLAIVGLLHILAGGALFWGLRQPTSKPRRATWIAPR